MLVDRAEMQNTLFKEIKERRLTVRDAEQVARRIATERTRRTDLTPELLLLERELTEKLGTRVRIEKKDQGGKVLIDFFSVDDLVHIREVFTRQHEKPVRAASVSPSQAAVSAAGYETAQEQPSGPGTASKVEESPKQINIAEPVQEDELYSIKNFTV